MELNKLLGLVRSWDTYQTPVGLIIFPHDPKTPVGNRDGEILSAMAQFLWDREVKPPFVVGGIEQLEVTT